MFAGVGERTREGNDLYREMIETVRSSSLNAQKETPNCTVTVQPDSCNAKECVSKACKGLCLQKHVKECVSTKANVQRY